MNGGNGRKKARVSCRRLSILCALILGLRDGLMIGMALGGATRIRMAKAFV